MSTDPPAKINDYLSHQHVQREHLIRTVFVNNVSYDDHNWRTIYKYHTGDLLALHINADFVVIVFSVCFFLIPEATRGPFVCNYFPGLYTEVNVLQVQKDGCGSSRRQVATCRMS